MDCMAHSVLALREICNTASYKRFDLLRHVGVGHIHWTFFAISRRIHRYIFIYFQKCCDHKNVDQGHDVHHLQWRHLMTNTLYDIILNDNSNECSISYRCEIFAKTRKIPNFDLEDEGQCQGVKERDLHQSTGNVRIHVGIFFII